LLARLQSIDFLARCSLEVHGEQERPDEHTGDACRYVLSGFETLFVGKSLNLDVVGLYFGLHLSARRRVVLYL
jgi:hypothetical protein